MADDLTLHSEYIRVLYEYLRKSHKLIARKNGVIKTFPCFCPSMGGEDTYVGSLTADLAFFNNQKRSKRSLIEVVDSHDSEEKKLKIYRKEGIPCFVFYVNELNIPFNQIKKAVPKLVKQGKIQLITYI